MHRINPNPLLNKKAFDPEQKVLVPVLEFIEAARKGNLEKVKECINNGNILTWKRQSKMGSLFCIRHVLVVVVILDIVRYLEDPGIE